MATYYVSLNGGGTQSGDVDNPKTFAWALTNAAAGDLILVMDGDYEYTGAAPANRWPVFNTTNSGTSGNPITFRAVNPLKARIISTRDRVAAWALEGRSYITIERFRIFGTLYAYTCNNIIFRDNEVTWGSWDGGGLIWGIVIQGSYNCTVSHNYVHDLKPRTTQTAVSDFQGGHNNMGICIESSCYNNTIEHNYVDGGGPRHISYNGGVESGRHSVMWAGIGEKGGGYYDNTIRRNFITGTRFGFIGIGRTDGSGKSDRELIYENIVTNTEKGGIDFDHGVRDWVVYNNVFANAPDAGDYCFGFGSLDSADPTSGDNRRITFYNNLYLNHRAVYRRELSFAPTYNGTYHATNLVAPYPKLTAGTSGSLATGTYWVRIATVNGTTPTGTGPSISVAVTGPTGSILVEWDKTSGSPTEYRVYCGTTDESQTQYVTVAATGVAGDQHSVTYTGTGTSTLAYSKSTVLQWQWPSCMQSSNYNCFYGNTAIAVHQSGGTVLAAALANWTTHTGLVGNSGTQWGAQDANSISSDPLVNTTTWDYRLPRASPARGVGQGGVHMGAYPSDVVSGGYGDIGPQNGYWVTRKPRATSVARAATVATATITVANRPF